MKRACLLALMITACAVDAPLPTTGTVESDLIVVCDPEFDPQCGLVTIPTGSVNLGGVMAESISNQPAGTTLTYCSGGGLQTVCGAALDNGYTVRCSCTNPVCDTVCSYTPPS